MENSASAGRAEVAPVVSLTRRYPVAAEKVWRAWTDPEALAQWFGQDEGSVVNFAELDVRVGQAPPMTRKGI
jgi:uncharacterized protein YndB with AHSA1/START domain